MNASTKISLLGPDHAGRIFSPVWQNALGGTIAVTDKASGEVLFEPSVASNVVEGLRGRGHRARVSKKGEVEIGSYGAAQLIYRVEGGYVAGSEGRRDGQAVGF